jgi:NADH-quinone oxidoreductase subunit H
MPDFVISMYDWTRATFELGEFDILFILMGFAKCMHNFTIFMLILTWLSWLERRLCAWIQDRSGPNRVGWAGLLQPVADAIKLMQKEDLVPHHVNKFLYLLGPCLVALPALVLFCVIPIGADIPFDWVTAVMGFIDINPEFVQSFSATYGGQGYSLAVASIPVGLAFLLAIGSLGVYGLALGAWSANNKYATMGGIRASAQMISYELALGVSIITLILMCGTHTLSDMTVSDLVNAQTGLLGGFYPMWNFFLNPITCSILIICYFAETNRLPFDFAEAEPELIAGYHIEHSGMRFALFMIGESAAMLTASALIVTLCFGGWHLPYVEGLMQIMFDGLLDYRLLWIPMTIGIFFGKVTLVVVFFMLVRWSIPRFRYDQLMSLGWKVFLPWALGLLVLTVAVKEIYLHYFPYIAPLVQ